VRRGWILRMPSLEEAERQNPCSQQLLEERNQREVLGSLLLETDGRTGMAQSCTWGGH